MKKILILALFVLGICNASAFGMTQEIILTELYSIIPLDDPGYEGHSTRPNPTRFHATIEGHQLFIEADTREPIYVEIISQKTGEVVAEREFIASTVILIPQLGTYTLQIYRGNSVFAGEFTIR